MKEYTEIELSENYEKFIKLINQVFKANPERLERLLHMYSEDELGMNLMMSPASSNVNYHNAYIGGYLDHVMSVIKNSLRMMKMYQEAGGVINFTQEELIFAAAHHDLGKLGFAGKMHYVPNPSEWHVKNKGEVYISNPDSSYMSHSDRTFFLLNRYQIQYTENEYFGIKLADGIYDDDNIKYYKTFDVNKYLRSNIQYIIHWADHMSMTIERDEYFKK
jgi:hypothetical protein